MDKNNISKNTLLISSAIFLIVLVFTPFFFFIDNYFQFKDWITLIVSFAGALMAGIFTMIGVSKTIKDGRVVREKEKFEYLNNTRITMKNEVEYSLKSIKEYYLNMLRVKLDWLKFVSEDMEKYILIETKPYGFDKYIMYDDVTKVNPEIPEIYFLDLNIKNDFFTLLNNTKNIDESYREIVLNEFLNLYKFEKKLLDLSQIYHTKEHMFMFNINRIDIDKDFVGLNFFIISAYLNLKENGIENGKFEKLKTDLDNLKDKNIFGERYKNLLKFLNEEY